MNKTMNVVISNKQYRVIVTHKGCYEDKPCYILSYKVQVKVLFFWITIKEFEEGVYDNDSEFCRSEAIELYNKIVNPYGTI